MQEESTLLSLPFQRWARKFVGGTVRIEGELPASELDGIQIRGGPAALAFAFAGGPQPTVTVLTLVADLDVHGKSARSLEYGDSMCVDGVPDAASVRIDLLLQHLVERFGDLTAEAEVRPDGEVLVKFQHGVQATLSAGTTVRIAASAQGPAHALQLCAPLTMQVDGEGVRLTHKRFRRLASLAGVRIEGATLDPDGRVRLRGGAEGRLDRLVRGGLAQASDRLSDLVRKSPRFARVRHLLAGRH